MESISSEAIDPLANVLLSDGPHADPVECRTKCRRVERTAELRVSFAGEGVDVPPTDGTSCTLGLPSVGDVIRTADAAEGPDFAGAVAIDAVADPTDLGSIGVSISRSRERRSDERLVVCFDSLDAPLRGAEPGTSSSLRTT
ncbi:hypothetical protein [Halovivax sp.]|uniref:hypothetical protein n=1 Tax=Halovivax sp. TaxID=1935978 RepID=UPI0025BD1FAF|nr:hypothetical protein [Halovivax sp.]